MNQHFMEHTFNLSSKVLFAFVPFWGFVFSTIIAIGYFLRPKRKENSLAGILYFIVAIPQLSMTLEIFGMYLSYPRLAFFFPPFYVWIGPLVYSYFCHILNQKLLGRKFYLLQLFPFLLVSCFMFALSNEPISSHHHHQILDFVLLCIFSYTIGFLIISVREFFPIFAFSNFPFPKIYSYTFALILIGFLDVVFFVWFQIEKTFFMMVLSYLTLTIITILIYFGGQIFPQYIANLQEEVKKSKYAKSRLQGIDKEEVIGKVKRLMSEEHLYADEDLTLTRFAEYVNLSPHQLSELLNQNLSVSFKTFLNQERIKAASRMLIEEPNRSILSILNAVGYSSKSSFHVEFLKYTGTTPTLFRKANQLSEI